MKKLLLATLVTAVFSAAASAQVVVSGKINKTFDRTEVGATSNNTVWTDPTSNIAVSVTEKIGGMTARGVVETSLSGNTFGTSDTRLGDRQTTVGLAGSLGSVDFGRNVHSHFINITSNDVFGTLYGSVAGDVHPLHGLRMSDAMFVAMKPTKDTTVMLERTQTGNQEITVYGANTKVAGVNATLTRYDQGSTKSTTLGLGAKGPMNTALHYVYSDNEGVMNGKAHLVGAAKRHDNFTMKASYGKNDLDVKAYSVGADYHLSKRTDVTVAYRNVDRAGAAHDVSQVGVGITHRF